MEVLFSTKERVKILRAVLYQRKQVSVNAFSEEVGLSKGLISKYFDILATKNILKRTNGKFIVNESAAVKSLKILFNINSIYTKIFYRYPFVKSVGLFGSCAKGENDECSDVDLWIKTGKVNNEKAASLASALNKSIGNLKILFLTDDKIKKMKKNDAVFYYALVFGSIVLWGDRNSITI